nr:CotD family spore coat protein [Bacillus massiliigorillae]
MPANVSPTNNVVNKNIFKHIVPHVHPTHTTTVNDHVFQHQHYFPQTQSVVNRCCNQQVICGGMPPMPTCCPPPPCCPPPRPFCC